MSRWRDSSLGQAWLILLLATLFGGALAAVKSGLGPRIEANIRAETLRQLPALVLPPGDLEGSEIAVAGDRIEVRWAEREPLALAVAESAVAGHRLFTLRGADGQVTGYVARGKGSGYADEIDLLVGLSPDLARLTGLYVLAQKETPALGDNITKPPFRDQFAGAPADRPLVATKVPAEAEAAGEKILALTAATISSRSVCDIVNQTVAEVRPALAAASPAVAAVEPRSLEGAPHDR